jgi:hypothetical protein
MKTSVSASHWLSAAAGLTFLAAVASAQPSLVEHTFSGGVFGQPAGITQREPEVPRDGETVDIYFRVSFQFAYDRVCVYYTTDGSEPSGSFGTPSGTTQVLRNDLGSISFLVNENSGGVRDWWKATLPTPTRSYNKFIKYKISAWKPFVGGEVFASGGLANSYLVKLAWPGAGAGQPSPSAGYPPVNFWKEEAFIGNTFTAAMLDQNGTWWDMYFPTPGGVQGVGTRNEGYSDGGDTFPALLSSEKRGQMHLNQAQVGIRVNGLTHWLSNPAGVSYTGVTQQYDSGSTNTVRTTQTLTAGGNNISVTQYDFAPAGIDFPDGLAGTGEQKHMLIKRMTLRNNTATTQEADVYFYVDPALNGGDTYDTMFWDAGRAAMTAYDKTRRTVTGTGPFISPPNEYNVTTFPGYEKNIALYLSAAMFAVPGPGHLNAGAATDSWRDTSSDDSQGWIGKRLTLPPGVNVDVNFMLAGAHFRPDPITAPMPAGDGVYNNEIAPMLDWFQTSSMTAIQNTTDAYWANWLANGVTIDTPDDRFDALMKRSLLATALHQDGVNGGIVAGYHNGAYYYVWPRDAMWAAVTLARSGHIPEARKAIDWMRDVSYRDFEAWGRKGFWKQKCSTDGFTIWGAPQIDGTAVFPWAVKYVDDLTADTAYLSLNYPAVRDSVLAMTTDSSDSRLRWEEAFNLTYSNNLWEDSYDTFIFSNANNHRGLVDAGKIANILGFGADATDAFNRAGWVKSGLDARLDWDGENTDISQLGIVYPFEVYSPTDFKAQRVINRINGIWKKFNGAHPTAEPLVNFAGFFNDGHGWTDLINRYWGDGYWGNGSSGSPWGAGPWFLTTMWYGAYYAARQDYTPGTGDIDNHKYRLELLLDQVGPMGLGAEQIAPRGIPGQPSPRNVGSLLYPGQNDFTLQTAWPNAWESMCFFVDSLMLFADYTPDARGNTMNFEPKLPSAWSTMTFNNIELNNGFTNHVVDMAVASEGFSPVHTFTNNTGFALNVSTVLRIDSTKCIGAVLRNGVPITYSYDAATGRVSVGPSPLETGIDATTEFRVVVTPTSDVDESGGTPDAGDVDTFFTLWLSGDTAADFDGSGGTPDAADIDAFFAAWLAGC